MNLPGKEVAGNKYQVLYRVINCLDCEIVDGQPLVSMYNSHSPMNEHVKRMIHLLEKRNLTQN